MTVTRETQVVPAMTNVPVPEASDPTDEDPGNLVIEGDNRQAMVSLFAQYQSQVDVVIIDVMLPALPGNRIAGLIRERMGSKGVRVLLYSSKEEAELKELAADCGADGWLKKSDDYDGLVALVRELSKK